MAKPIRPLTFKERKRPAQLMYEGGFKNVSFQVGEIIFKGDDLVQPIPGLRHGVIKKSEKVQFPVMIPTSVPIFKGDGNIICSVFGRKNPVDGKHDAFLVARNMERLSSFNIELRTIQDLRIEESTQDTEHERFGKGHSAKQHNQVNLCGVVVGAAFEDGDNPKFHIQLRQTSNPENIIELCYEAKNAGSQVGRIKIGTVIYAEGEYAYRKIPVNKADEQGNPLFDEKGQRVYETDENGEIVKRVHTYIRISAPKEANFEFDINFLPQDPPKWITEMIELIESKKTRAIPQDKKAAATGTELAETADL